MINTKGIKRHNKENQSSSYSDLLAMPQWQAKRRIILNRDKHQCRSCGNKQELHVHHRQYQNNAKTGEKKMPWDYANRYLITLCATCHRNGHIAYTIPVFSI
jgi:5-methylcytosine-specific restriction endonuclease McrA